jgi:type IV secretory pathway TrbF-like protein
MAITKRLPPPPEAVLRLYEQGRREWDNRLGSYVKAAHNWRLAFFATLVPLLVSIALAGYLGAQPKAVPHVIEVDRIGAAHYRGPAGESAKTYAASDRAIRYHLRTFVTELRSVSSDAAIITSNIVEAWNWSTPAAQNIINKHVREKDPYKRSVEERVSVDVQSLLALSRDSWQVDWKETRFDAQGVELDTLTWRGTFRLVFRLTDTGVTEEMLEKNPLGLYIDYFDWARL